MNRTVLIHLALFLFSLPSAGMAGKTPLAQKTISELQQQKQAIESALSQLSAYSLRTGTGSIGYRSDGQESPDGVKWIQIHLEQETRIDQIVLVPAIWRQSIIGFHAEAFPVEFKIFAGTKADTNGTVIASFGESDHLQPRIAPLIVDANGIKASWIKLICTRLSQRSFDQTYCLELSEILIFSGLENVALHQSVTASHGYEGAARAAAYLVDGFMPYLMNTSRGANSMALISTISTNTTATLEIDLGSPQPLDSVYLHAVEQSDTVPQSFVGALGIPQHLKIEGANHADFSDAFPLKDIYCRTVYEAGPILMHRLPGTSCRYVRFSALDPYTYSSRNRVEARFGFAEIELISNGINVALGKPVTANFELTNKMTRSFSSLTDGQNIYGKIIPIRDWLNELARRHELENELPLVMAELDNRYSQQHQKNKILSWITLTLIIAIGFIVLIEKLLRMRQVARLKERFAADLHDELGANLHAIGFLGSHAKDVLHSPEKLAQTVDEINALATRAGDATRYCTDMQSAGEAHENLPADMKRTARRIIAQHAYSVAISGEEILQTLKPRSRADLFLFFKESLININRHADATEVQIELAADAEHINLNIRDNGCGMAYGETAAIPSSLQRRAKLLGATVSVASSEAGGTCISLKLKTPRKQRFRKKRDAS